VPNNILITPGSASIQFSGSAANTIRLQVETSGSIAFYGNSGSLFGITDSLSGSLMSVNDISGLPILEVFSDDRIVMGTFNKNTLVVTGSRIGIDKAVPTADLDISGSVFITGSLRMNSGGITGSLFGTASNATSASFAVSASWAPSLGTASNVAGGTTNYIPLWSSTTALSSSVLFQSASNLGINTKTPSASFHVVGTTILQGVIERVNITASAPPTTLNFDALSGSVFYLSGSSANNWTINFRGSAATSLNSMMYSGQSMTFAVLVNHSTVGYTASVHQVDGTAITPRWQGGTLPSGSGASTDIYSYTLIKTANAAFNIFASQTKFA